MAKGTMLKLFQMGTKGGGSADADSIQVSPPAEGGPSGGGKSQAGKREIDNPSQYGKPPVKGPKKGNMRTPAFEDIIGAVKAVAEEKKTANDAAVDLFFEEDDDDADDDDEGSSDDDKEGGGKKKSKKKAKAKKDDEDESTDEGDSMKPGGGGRFKKLKKKLASRGAKNTGALAAYIGRKKYGKKKFQKMAAKGDSEEQDPANTNEADPPPGDPAVATAKGNNAGQAPTPKVDGPPAGELLSFKPSGAADATSMGSYEEQLRKWLDAAVSQKKLWVGGIFLHKNGPNEFYLDHIASGTVTLDAAVKACVKFGDVKLAPPGAPSDDLK